MSFMSWHSLPRTLQGFNAVIHFCAGTRYNSQLSFHGFRWVSLTHELTSPTNYETVFILYIPIHVYQQVNPQNYIPWTLFIIDHFLKKNWSSRIKMIAQQLVIDCKGGGGLNSLENLELLLNLKLSMPSMGLCSIQVEFPKKI